MNHNRYRDQADLLIKALPIVMKEEDFALKGGTAINLFIRDMPRLSVDIDLTFLPLLDRPTTIEKINEKMAATAQRLQRLLPSSQTTLIHTNEGVCRNIQLNQAESVIKIEINHVLRGQVMPEKTLPLCLKAQEEFEAFFEVRCLAFEDLYGGKLCAALSRQHPRDLFDVKLLLEAEGISDQLRKVFLVYMASGNGSISNMLDLKFKNVRLEFDREFLGMSFMEASYEDLERTREKLIKTIQNGLTEDEKEFLLSFKSGNPKWDLLGFEHLQNLPGLQWKLRNIKKMESAKRHQLLKKLEQTLSF